MAELVNLRQYRKKQKRKDESKTAEQNRVVYGRTKVEKSYDQRIKLRLERSAENQKLQPSTSQDGTLNDDQ